MNMVQCSKVVTGHRYDTGLLKGCNQFVKEFIGISFMFMFISFFSLTTFLH